MSNSQPLVSVIVPIFNSANYLAETIESVLDQEYENWELLLVDDGSVDNSSEIARQYASQYPSKIIYAEHPGHINKGVTATRNLAISKAKGDLVAFLDSDDLWKVNYLKEQVHFMTTNPAVNVSCEATLYWNSWQDASLQDEVIPVGTPSERTYQPPYLLSRMYPFGSGLAPCMCGIMIRITSLKRIGGFEESFVGKNQLYEDQAFIVKMYLNETLHVSSRCNNIYRQRANSLMHGIVDDGYYNNGRLFFLNWFKQYLQANRINNVYVRWQLFKAMLPFRFPLIHKISSGLSWRYKQWFKLSVNAG